MYAIIETGGKQYRVSIGDTIKVERIEAEKGNTVELGNVLMLSDAEKATFGTPYIPSARVVAEVVSQGRDKKVISFKQKPRKGYRKTIGHRQPFTDLRIKEIIGGLIHGT